MTERTHDLAALTALTIALVVAPPDSMTVGTLAAAVIANQIGSSVPDFDQPTAEFYRELPAGSLVGKLISPLFGGHRFISHSLIGISIIGWALNLALQYLSQFLVVDMNVIWWSFMLGYASHLIMDTLTKDGAPWFFPIPLRIGIPPFRWLRIKTGTFLETFGVYPGLVVLNGYLIYTHYSQLANFFSNSLVK